MIFTENSLRNYNVVTFVEYRRWKRRKCIAIAIVLCQLENTPSHINKNNHLIHGSPENKRNVGICWAKRWTGFKLDATCANFMQYSPTWCTNVSTCCVRLHGPLINFSTINCCYGKSLDNIVAIFTVAHKCKTNVSFQNTCFFSKQCLSFRNTLLFLQNKLHFFKINVSFQNKCFASKQMFRFEANV